MTLMIEGVSSTNRIFFDGSDFRTSCPCPSTNVGNTIVGARGVGNALGKGVDKGVFKNNVVVVIFGKSELNTVLDVEGRNLGILRALLSAVSSLR